MGPRAHPGPRRRCNRDADRVECEGSIATGALDGRQAMIPEFDEHGYLPAGVHPATLDEVAARFSELIGVEIVRTP